MKYYVLTDIHGFFSLAKKALEEKGFFSDTEPHKLIICGDLFDRGTEVFELQNFVLDLMAKDEVILIKGNHEDLAQELLENAYKWFDYGIIRTHHWHNGTVQTFLQLSNMDLEMAFNNRELLIERIKATDYFKKIIPSMLDYYETRNYVFVHGWIPTHWEYANGLYGAKTYESYSDWRNASEPEWESARWLNGIEAARQGVILEDKTIVCGHYHCSYGWAQVRQKRKEFPDKNLKNWRKSFEPYIDNGIIALDACTAYSGIVNCVVLEDEGLET